MVRVVAGGVSLLVALAPAGGAESGRVPVPGRAGELPLYHAGDQVDGLPLVAVLRRDDTASFVSFVYGDCTPGDDAGCAPPVEIQVWPACRRNLSFYDGSQAHVPMAERTRIRSVPALAFDDGTRLELETGGSTVVVFADSAARALRVAGALRSPNGSLPAGAPLPHPTRSAADGAPTC